MNYVTTPLISGKSCSYDFDEATKDQIMSISDLINHRDNLL